MSQFAPAIALLLVASAAGGATHAAGVPDQARTRTLLEAPRYVEHPLTTEVTGGSPAMRAAIGRVLSGIDSSHIRRIRVGAPPPNLPNRATFPPRAVWLYVDVTPDPVDRLAIGWVTEVLAHALVAIAAARGLSPILGMTADDGSPPGHGTSLPRDYFLGSRLPYPAPSGSSIRAWTPSKLVASFRANAARSGLAVRSVTVQQPLGLAAVVRATTTDDRWAFAADLSKNLALLLADAKSTEGTLVEIRNSSGTLVYVSASMTRRPAAYSSNWINENWWPTSCAPPTPAAHVAAGSGSLVGGEYLVGGPWPGIHECSARPYTVAVLDATGRTIATQTVTGYHSYAIALPPGTYSLRGTPCGEGKVTITAGETTAADVICHIP